MIESPVPTDADLANHKGPAMVRCFIQMPMKMLFHPDTKDHLVIVGDTVFRVPHPESPYARFVGIVCQSIAQMRAWYTEIEAPSLDGYTTVYDTRLGWPFPCIAFIFSE